MTTINRTLRSCAGEDRLGYVLRWVPAGTMTGASFPLRRSFRHWSWRAASRCGIGSIVPDPFTGGFRLSGDTGETTRFSG